MSLKIITLDIFMTVLDEVTNRILTMYERKPDSLVSLNVININKKFKQLSIIDHKGFI